MSVEDLKIILEQIERDMEGLESLNRIYPGRYDQRLSLAYSRYKRYCLKLDEALRNRMDQHESK